jgi:hypothetical protein
MQNLHTEDLFLVTRDMLSERAPDIRLLFGGALYLAQLQAASEALDAALQQEATALPLTQELANLDDRHDNFARAIARICEAHALSPSSTPATLARVERIRAALVPSAQELTAPYTEEAALAVTRAPKLEALRPDLEAIPVGDGATLFDWASSFIQAGLDIERLIFERATQTPTPPPRGNNPTSQAMSLLSRLRRGIRDELALRPDLPRDLEARIFVQLDAQQQRRQQAQAPAAPPAQP